MANSFAYLVLYLSPLVVVLLFRALPRTPALIWSVVGGYLFLPVGIGLNLPLLPALTKDLLPVLTAAVMCLVVAADRPGETAAPLRTPRPATLPATPRAGRTKQGEEMEARPAFTRQRTHVARQEAAARRESAGGAQAIPARQTLVGNILLALLVGTPFLTAMQNADPVIAGPTFIPGLRPYDAFSLLLGALVTVLPLLLARRYLATPAHHMVLLHILCVAGLIYSLPALFEVRMSPQLNVWFYGYFPHSFAQQYRDGGFRPVVFIQHGLMVALFFAVTVVAAFALWRTRTLSTPRAGALMAGVWLLGVLVLCKTLGALISTLLLLPVVLLAPKRMQMILAAAVAMTVLLYPMLRGADLIPVDRMTGFAASINEERAQSFQFRLDNEDILLDRANLKPFAGWGSWGRNRVHDAESGSDISVTDGAWIIVIGVYGWIGYVAQFGFLTIPTLLLALRQRAFELTFATTGLCLVLAVNLIDLIPNTGLTPLTWLIAGAVLGYWERGGQAAGHQPVPDTRRPVTDRDAALIAVRDRSGAAVRQSGGR
jgi:hypothetical protein